MIEYWLIAGSYLAAILVPIILIRKLIAPRLEEVVEMAANLGKLAGVKSGEVRASKAVEKAVAGDVLDSLAPEVRPLLKLLSPDTLEMVEDNPEMVISLMHKYGPYIKQLLGVSEQGKGQYDL